MQITSYEPGTPCWVDLGSPDVVAACEFYGEIFGWDLQDQGPDAGNYRLAMLKGDSVAGIAPAQRTDVPPFWTTYVSVSDVDTTTKAATEAGGTVLAEPMDVMGQGRMAVYADPTGAQVSAWQPMAKAGSAYANEPGAFAWSEIWTREPEKAKAFYADVFGWKPVSADMGNGRTYTTFELDGRGVAGITEFDVPSAWRTYFAVADADATVAQVKQLGGTQYSDAMDVPTVGRVAALVDPQGAHFSVIKLAPERQ